MLIKGHQVNFPTSQSCSRRQKHNATKGMIMWTDVIRLLITHTTGIRKRFRKELLPRDPSKETKNEAQLRHLSVGGDVVAHPGVGRSNSAYRLTSPDMNNQHQISAII
ncbi:hypothetical protein BaRGS_00022178 [Batillaria attramentaria]|uniref:Uncharacterized protein n=1 Tax=Batillaria attramentaria TaxID=370345 RepID=A0ABD0KHK0_9CAEN